MIRPASAMTQPGHHHSFLPGHVVVIICSITVQLLDIARNIQLEKHEHLYHKIVNLSVLGLLFLSYPLLGYIADVCLTRYRTIKCSLITLIIGCTIGLVLAFIDNFVTVTERVTYILTLTLIVLVTTGVGLFKANCIQFGLDQLLEAPTPKLIAFIHWYYWTHNAVQLVVTYLIIVVEPEQYLLHGVIKKYLTILILSILGLAPVSSLVLLHKSKRHLYILRAGLNPFKNIYKVLKYSWNHKGPSAS